MHRIIRIFRHPHPLRGIHLLLSTYLLSTFLLSFPVPSAADEAAAQLDKMIVTATRTEKTLETAPGSVAIVTPKEIANRQIFSVDQTLNLLPGVIAGRAGLRDTMSYLTVEGFPARAGR